MRIERQRNAFAYRLAKDWDDSLFGDSEADVSGMNADLTPSVTKGLGDSNPMVTPPPSAISAPSSAPSVSSPGSSTTAPSTKPTPYTQITVPPNTSGLAAATSLAQQANGRPYDYGGTGKNGQYDCSGYMSDIYNALTGKPLGQRSFSTTSNFGALGFQPGYNAQSPFNIGVNPQPGMSGHMAGELNGVNVESGGPKNMTQYGGAATGPQDKQFSQQWHLPNNLIVNSPSPNSSSAWFGGGSPPAGASSQPSGRTGMNIQRQSDSFAYRTAWGDQAQDPKREDPPPIRNDDVFIMPDSESGLGYDAIVKRRPDLGPQAFDVIKPLDKHADDAALKSAHYEDFDRQQGDWEHQDTSAASFYKPMTEINTADPQDMASQIEIRQAIIRELDADPTPNYAEVDKFRAEVNTLSRKVSDNSWEDAEQYVDSGIAQTDPQALNRISPGASTHLDDYWPQFTAQTDPEICPECGGHFIEPGLTHEDWAHIQDAAGTARQDRKEQKNQHNLDRRRKSWGL